MTTLLDSAKSMLTDAVISKASSLIGLDASSATSSIGKFLPAIIGGLISKGNTESGAQGLLDIFKNKGLSDLGMDDLMDVLGSPEKGKSMLESGGDLLGTIFGNKQDGILEKLVGMTGIKKAGGSMLMKFAGMVFKNGWGAKKLSSYMTDQKSSISGMIPGMSGLLGFAGNAASKAGSTATAAASAATSAVTGGDDNGGGGWWKWLLPLLLIGAIIFGLSKSGMFGEDKTADTEMDGDAETTEMTTGNDGMATSSTTTTTSTDATMSTGMDTKSTTVTAPAGGYDLSKAILSDNGDFVDADGNVILSGANYALDADGNIIGENGNVLVEAANVPAGLLSRIKAFLGKYSGKKLMLNDAGDLVDGSGNIISKAGEFEVKNGFFYDKDGNKLGRAWAKFVNMLKNAAGKVSDAAGAAAGAVGDAAAKTKDAMTNLFSGMISKTEGASTSYALNNIEFNEEGNRITNFSKNEIEGLAAALKANPTGKVVVNGYTNDGGGDMKNKTLSKKRANVVHDMLVTLGVKASQISFKGMGTGDNRIEVTSK
jgi:outer membrane protein OmpA-like peptidoglycan-associated protein